MPIKAFVTEAEFAALPEKIEVSKSDAYGKTEGGLSFKLEAAGGYENKPVEKLVKALDSERKQREQFEASLKAFDGLDAKAARDAIATMDDWKKSNPEEKAKKAYEATLAQAQAEHMKAMERETAKGKKLQSQLERLTAKAAISQAMREAGAEDILEPHIAGRVKTEIGADGEVSFYVADETGAKASTWDGTRMVPMSLGQLISEMKTQPRFQPGFRGSGASGSGARGSSGGSGGAGAFTMTRQQASDPREYARMREAATKAGQMVQIVG